MTYEKLLQEIKKYWADQSRSAEETASDLRSLVEEIEVLIDSLG